jgi:hypothetical protein
MACDEKNTEDSHNLQMKVITIEVTLCFLYKRDSIPPRVPRPAEREQEFAKFDKIKQA